ncbi:glucosaminidase domain-containing protein [Gilvimarinus sp. SDUM040013]|uniref:Glucosaminidase domain-containing protein n=1 Tax=Gilvimarinus gilvus TaxID=3058038 RepID=A0ABU4RT13_9GAMM|nr:glucosaminidase domain-containing protein [Gilvimarinus sp. SDUM040013]MDO3388254.1 glucosaminidase domain-containing protein [Gilvimarinus sp. SDUM040013]MDX6847804.1 glucosaminidase domain-containing protein [Gilvimarinus sp. SDUM040013]
MTRLMILLTAIFTLLGASNFALAAGEIASGGEKQWQEKVVNNYQEVLALFERLDYTETFWRDGERAVPRVYIATIPKRWSKETSKEITVQLKKKIFFRTLGPLVLRSNELILQDRAKLETLAGKSGSLDSEQLKWLEELSGYYRASWDPAQIGNVIAELLVKVDALPTSLIIAQAVEESGWGTSRFAFSGNALFGQWTWGDDGITPEQQRSGMGDYKIAAFDSPLQSVQAHARNLNTHPAYQALRDMRAEKRKAGQAFTGMDAATTLTKYSERGEAYVKTLHSIISYNKLQTTDAAYLKEMEAIVLVPEAH